MPPKARQSRAAKADTKDSEDVSVEKLAAKHWQGKSVKWAASVVDQIIEKVFGSNTVHVHLQWLERQQYLEQFLWPHYSKGRQHESVVLSCMLMINEKYEQGLLTTMWTIFETGESLFGNLFDDVVQLIIRVLSEENVCIGQVDMTSVVRMAGVQFLIACFGSLETECVRKQCMGLVGLAIWYHMEEEARNSLLSTVPQLPKFWKHTQKGFKENKRVSKAEAEQNCRNRDFVPLLLRDLVKQSASLEHQMYCAKVLELLIDLESQLPTRRFLSPLLQDFEIIEECRQRMEDVEDGLCKQLLSRLDGRMQFPVTDVTGHAQSAAQVREWQLERIARWQLQAFQADGELFEPIVIASAAQLGSAQSLQTLLEPMGMEQVQQLAQMALVRTRSAVTGEEQPREMLVRSLCARMHADVLGEQKMWSPYPDEQMVFGKTVGMAETYGRSEAGGQLGYGLLGVPKLGLQYLSEQDFLKRSFELLQLETAAELRAEIQEAVRRMQPHEADGHNEVIFEGWTRMALPLSVLDVVTVQRPHVGENVPARVQARLEVDLNSYTDSIKAEWKQVRPHDVLILLTVRQSGVMRVRGCQVEAVDIPEDEGSSVLGFRVLLDTAQYARDISGNDDVYGGLNVVLRRQAQGSSFKPVLETLRQLADAPPALPKWLAPVVLGYGDPAAVRQGDEASAVFMGDTFVSVKHIEESFGDYGGVEVAEDVEAETPMVEVEIPADTAETVQVRQAGQQSSQLPWLRRRKHNKLLFTPTQVRAIAEAGRRGLTLVVGPPGTGKTDVAAQIVSNLYHAHPQQTVLLLTHSNQALNQLFERIVALDIEPRHLLRLGHGEEALDSAERFSNAGRIESFLERRRELLAQVQTLADSLQVPGDYRDSCESARFFYVAHVRVRWDAYLRKAREFPFTRYFQEQKGSNEPLFPENCDEEAVARACFAHLERLFDEVAEIQPFELLQSARERALYLLKRQARVVAMTCTHAAMRLGELQQMGVRIGSVVMEEAAQVLDVETLLPLTLSRDLERVVLIGDHNQLPPVVKSPGLRAFSRMEQSLFARLIRLGVPFVELDCQARARPSIASLYRHRYRCLRDLEPLVTQGAYARPNPGFGHVLQFIDVADYQGQGESEPSRYFYQNLGEAEYVVAVYQYMRLVGYSSEQVAILTTYNGQRALINDVLARRCRPYEQFGMPRAVSTVDQFQGQQADFVLLSLVRTRNIGHIRDIRRLTVALSRAKLGLYVFGRRSLFEPCFELQSAMQMLLANGDQLVLEKALSAKDTKNKNGAKKSIVIKDVEAMGKLVVEMTSF
ncbi:hypothetical protein IWW36_001911 [Coemansia brasiliensis]|uniref:Pre-mRNA-splicing factor n=1 Tax=Coemansia brasiliensis TaxID=2650707 RepID=A0A9W8I8W4_9FUNG|nr:hypothetical protein IWW36_001911 [Coemansia brasiliensis]